MLVSWICLAVTRQAVDRTPSVYRCPAAEAESKFFPSVVDDYGFDAVCIEPKPGPTAAKIAKGKLKLVQAKALDTPANRRWRDLTVSFAAGKISPSQWLQRTRALRETYHWLSSPKTLDLRKEMASVPVDPGGAYSARSVFAEMLLLSWSGTPCLTSTDTGLTGYLPEDPKFESWVLAMRDFLGPMLSFRHDNPKMVTGKPEIIRADSQPGLLEFRSAGLTFYLNNSFAGIKLPRLSMEKVTINHGLNVDGPEPVLNGPGFLIESK